MFNSLRLFWRELVNGLSGHITVGIINITIAWCNKHRFDKDKSIFYLSTAADWLKNISSLYGNHPYISLVELRRKA